MDINGRTFDISVRRYLRHWRRDEFKAFNVNNQKYNMKVYITKMDDFYGFELDGNGRFCLASGIVTHNSGKSTVFKEILLHLLEVTDSKIGVISLEESPAETGRILTGMSINTNFAFNPIHRDKYKDDFNKIFKSEKIILLDHGGSAPSELSLLDKIEYMCLIGCRYILFDHITLFAAESSDGSNDNAIMDSIMAHLAGIVKKYPVWIGLISHLRKVVSGGRAFESGVLPSIDDIKGSGSLKQICYDIIAFTRDMTADDEAERNNVIAAILKCRFTGLTGKVSGFKYEYQTGRLKAIENTEFTEV
jgi:twinkle protein